MAVINENLTLNVNEFNSICRTCLSTQDLHSINGIYDADAVSIEFILNKYTQVELDDADNLPKQICSKCIKKLYKAYLFLNSCNLINTILTECSARYKSNIRCNIYGPSDTNSLVNSQEPAKSETKEESVEIFDSDNCNTETINDVTMPSVITEGLHTAVDIKEEPQVLESMEEKFLVADYGYLEVQLDYDKETACNDWNLQNHGTMNAENSNDVISKAIKRKQKDPAELTLYVPDSEVGKCDALVKYEKKDLPPNEVLFVDSCIYDDTFTYENSINTMETRDTENMSLDCSFPENMCKRKRFKNKDYCFFCNKLVTNFARHLKRHHYEESEVKQCYVNRIGSRERKRMLKLLRNKSNFVKKSNTVNKSHNNVLPCIHCLGYFARKRLTRHMRQCFANTEKNNNTNCLSEAQNILLRRRKIHENLRDTVFPRMRVDRISLVAKQDELICAFGAKFLRIPCKITRINTISNRMRNIAKLLIEINKINPKIENLFHVLDAEHYDLIVEATKIVAKYNPDEKNYKSPHYAINIGTLLKQCCDIAIIYARKSKKFIYCTEMEANLRKMKDLLRFKWKSCIMPDENSNVKKNEEEANISLNENSILPVNAEREMNEKTVSHESSQPVVISVKSSKRQLIPWTEEQKMIVNEYFKQHILENKPPKRHECETLKNNNFKLLENKNWLKIKVYVQNKYTKKYKEII